MATHKNQTPRASLYSLRSPQPRFKTRPISLNLTLLHPPLPRRLLRPRHALRERLLQWEAPDAERLRRHRRRIRQAHKESLSDLLRRDSQSWLRHRGSKPSGNACREDVRFYIRDLMTRMKVGDVEKKKQALVKLNEAMEEDDRYVRVVIESNDVVHTLVGFLDSEVGVQEESVKALFFISGFGSYRSVLVRSGVIGPLVRVLESGSDVGREVSARCLMKLTENSENAWSVSAHGGVSALLKICSCSELKGELIASSCGVLRNLVGVEEIKRYMIEEDDTVTTFIKLIGSREEIVQVNSIDLLLSLCAKGEQTREIFVKQGGIQELVSVLSDHNPSKSKEIALRAIDNLCFGSSSCLNALMSCKFLDHLLYLLRNGETSVQESALKVTSRLCSLPEDVKS